MVPFEKEKINLSIMRRIAMSQQVLGPVFDKASAAADSFISSLPGNLKLLYLSELRNRITADAIIPSIFYTIVVKPEKTFVLTVRQSNIPRQGPPVVGYRYTTMIDMTYAPPGSKIVGNQGDLTKTLGEVGGFKNSAEIKQKNNINSIIGVKGPVGIINRGEIEQKGMLNLRLGI